MSSAAPMQQAKTGAAVQTAPYTNQLSVQSQQISTSDTQNEFSDPRTRATAQRQLQDAANHSIHSRQLKSHQLAQTSARSMQLKVMNAMMNTPVVQRLEEEEALQTKSAGETMQREASAGAAEVTKSNNTGLPDNLKSGIESLSGMSLDHVKVHYNSSQPAQLNAHAYAQGSDIHLAPGQEQHLPHEAWHVVQQAQGRVQPTMQMKGVNVNDDVGLELEADQMGARAVQLSATGSSAHVLELGSGTAGTSQLRAAPTNGAVAQLLVPTGNFATYDAANVAVNGQNAGNNPTDTIVRNSGTLGPASNPPDPGGWADMTQDEADMLDPVGGIPVGENTSFSINVRIDSDNSHNYTKMHAVNSWLGLGTNHADNIFSGRQSFNKSHNDRIEGTATGFLQHQSWLATCGTNLTNSLNGADQIGRNGGGQAYYKAGLTNSFPAAFYDAGTIVVGNDGNNYPSLREDVMALRGYALEYRVQPSYALNAATVRNNITVYGMNRYNNRLNAAHAGETFDVAGGSEIHNAVEALRNSYATSLRIDLTTYAPNPGLVVNGTDIFTNALSWHTYATAPVVMNAPAPAADMKLHYLKANGHWNTRWYRNILI
jgi:hypothetical protein